MKFRTKLVLSVMLMISVILSFSRYFIVSQNFNHSMDNIAKQNINQYTLEKYILENNIVKYIQQGEELTQEKLIEYVKELYSYKIDNLDKIAIYSKIGKKIFSNFETGINIESFFKKEVDGYYIKKLGEKYYMVFPSNWSINGEELNIINAYDITSIFEQRNAQAYEILITDIIILILSAVFIIIFTAFLTAPIENLNEMSKKIASGKFSNRVKVNSKDEIGELANNFNIMAEQIEKTIKQLNTLIKQKDDFVNSFNHELKTPITAITGYADLLRLKECDEELNKRALNYIYSEAKRLELLSHKLMQLMSLSEDRICLENIQITSVIEKVVKTQTIMLGDTKVELQTKKATVKGDIELLEVVIKNLIENAKKAEPRSNKIVIKGEKIKNNKYRIYIIDDGKGIPKEHLEKVTQSFYVVDKARARTNGGSGIGLALCKKILEIHNSGINIQSTPNIGTTVYFDLEVV